MPCRPAICSHSLGRAWVHSLPQKLDQAARHGLDIELFYEDLLYFSRDLPGSSPNDRLLAAAHAIRVMCDDRGLTIMCLQPFMDYEGLKDRAKHAERLQEMHLWIELVLILGAAMISIPSTIRSKDEMSGNIDLIVSDLQEVAEMCAPHGIQLAYESLCWGTYSDTWEQSYEIVRRVDRANFGLCLDTFNIAGRAYADPTSPTRTLPDAEIQLQASLKLLATSVDVKKIFYVQVVDAEYLEEPLVEGHHYYNPNQPARMSWSRNCRLFYGESDRGAYLPVKAILKAILMDLGFEGWISAELFNQSLADPDQSVPERHAQRASLSWQKIVEDFDLQVRSGSSSAPHVQHDQIARAQL